MMQAEVAQVQIGYTGVKGIMTDCGSFAVPVHETASFFGFPKGSALKRFKVLLGSSFQTIRVQVEDGQYEECLSLQAFGNLLQELDRKGDERAQLIEEAIDGRSLYQIFADAFASKFEEEEFNAYLAPAF